MEEEEEVEEERIVSGNLLRTSHTNVIGMGTQDKTKVTLQPKELEVLYRFLHVERFEIISMIEKNRVVGLTVPTEPFLMAIRKKWMAVIGVAANYNTIIVEKEEKRKQEQREIRDKNKKI